MHVGSSSVSSSFGGIIIDLKRGVGDCGMGAGDCLSGTVLARGDFGFGDFRFGDLGLRLRTGDGACGFGDFGDFGDFVVPSVGSTFKTGGSGGGGAAERFGEVSGDEIGVDIALGTAGFDSGTFGVFLSLFGTDCTAGCDRGSFGTDAGFSAGLDERGEDFVPLAVGCSAVDFGALFVPPPCNDSPAGRDSGTFGGRGSGSMAGLESGTFGARLSFPGGGPIAGFDKGTFGAEVNDGCTSGCESGTLGAGAALFSLPDEGGAAGCELPAFGTSAALLSKLGNGCTAGFDDGTIGAGNDRNFSTGDSTCFDSDAIGAIGEFAAGSVARGEGCKRPGGDGG